MELAIDQLLSTFPACQTVNLVVSWFFNSESVGLCNVYPSTTYQNNGSVINPATGLPYSTLANSFQYWNGSSWSADHWRVSSLDETTSGLIPISQSNGSFTYGGTPSDQSVVQCIQYLKAQVSASSFTRSCSATFRARTHGAGASLFRRRRLERRGVGGQRLSKWDPATIRRSRRLHVKFAILRARA